MSKTWAVYCQTALEKGGIGYNLNRSAYFTLSLTILGIFIGSNLCLPDR